MKDKPFDFIRFFKRTNIVHSQGETCDSVRVRGGYSVFNIEWLARKAVDNALSRVLSNIRGFDAGSVFPAYASYLSESENGTEQARAVMDSGYVTTEADIICARNYYMANMICYAMRRYSMSKSTIKSDMETDTEFRRTYLDDALEMLSLACERGGFSMQAALKRFADNPDGHFKTTNCDTVQNLLYREIRVLLRDMTETRMTNGFSDYSNMELYNVISLLYKMTYNVDKDWFKFRCGHIYRMWGLKLRGECDFDEIPAALR